MQLIQLNESTWVIQGGANIRVLTHEGRCLLIDSGMAFYNDIQAGLTTLAALKTQRSAFRHRVAGCGEIHTTAEQANRAIECTELRLESILELVRKELTDDTPRALAELLAAVARARSNDQRALTTCSVPDKRAIGAQHTVYARRDHPAL